MLTALYKGEKIDAALAHRGLDYSCPKCKRDVTLKKGRIVIPHFAHKPPTGCTWAVGETKAHLTAKKIIRDEFRRRGHQADYEVEVLSVGGDRRADVLIRSASSNQQVAIEIQHQPILFDAIENRTSAYMAAGIPVMWVGILTDKIIEAAEMSPNGLIIRKYTIRPWEKWAQAFYFGKELWYIDPFAEKLWQGSFSDHNIEVESTSWYENGEEQYAGGYIRRSKRWRTLHLKGPFNLEDVKIAINSRSAWQSKTFSLPAGKYALFTS